MKKKLLILLILLNSTLFEIAAQNSVDYTIHYDFFCISDTSKKEYLPSMEFMLLKAGHLSTFITSGRYYNDSTHMVFEKEHPQPTFNSQEEVQKYADLYLEKRDVKSVGSDYKIFKNFKTGNFRLMLPFMTLPAQYLEEPMDFDWDITGEVDTILGLICTKATTQYGGRIYNAWFSPEIPISDGPWTFRGLPGLILKTTDEREWYTFTATNIITRKTNRYLNPDWINEHSEKIDRKTFVDKMTAHKRSPQMPPGMLDFPEESMLARKKAYEKRFDLLIEQY